MYNIKYTAQRIASFQISFRVFLNNPILGYGGYMDASWTKKLGANIAAISGIGEIMARFGIVGTFFFLYSLFRTSKLLQSAFSFKGWIFPILVILAISISYSVVGPILLCIWLFYLFGDTAKEIKETGKTELRISEYSGFK